MNEQAEQNKYLEQRVVELEARVDELEKILRLAHVILSREEK